MITVLVLYLLAATLAAAGVVALPRYLREFCLTPRTLCRFCTSRDSCPVRNLKLSLKLEPRERPLVVQLPSRTHVISFDRDSFKEMKLAA